MTFDPSQPRDDDGKWSNGGGVRSVSHYSKDELSKRGAGEGTDKAVHEVFGDKAPHLDDLEKSWSGAGLGAHITAMRPMLGGVQVEGEIRDAGKKVGSFMRTFSKDSRGLVVKHDELFLDDDQQGRGFGKEHLASSIAAYEAMGVKAVDLEAAKVGRYTWASFGFEWNDRHAEKVEKRLAKFLTKAGMDSETAASVAKESAKHAFNVAALEHKGKRVGKEFLLSEPNWMGSLALDHSAPGYQRAKKRLGL